MDDGERIELHVYDLSNGMAAQWGRALTGRQVDGIWHTSLVLYGMEVFYGQGISIVSPPGTTHHGTPQKRLPMGSTFLDRETFLEYIEGLKEVYAADNYHLLDFNCNSFTNDVLGFLNGGTIPDDIRNLPRDILSTPFGQQMRPMIDQMFSGRSGPPASTAVSSLLPPRAPADDAASPQSIASNLQICTSASSLRSILGSSKAVAVMYTSASCPPCTAVKPVFEELARTHGTTKERIDFVLVEMGVGGANEVAGSDEFGGPVRATPTFVFFAKGKKVGECKGGDVGELKTQVELLEMEAYPPHPHTKLSLPALTKLSHSLSPVTYPVLPSLPTLSSKLASFLTDASMTSPSLLPSTIPTLTFSVIAYLTSLPTPPALPATPLPPTLTKDWTSATLNALCVLPRTEWFPLLDLWRIGLAHDLPRLSPTFATLLPQLLSEDYLLAPGINSKPLLLTTLRLLSNALPSPVLAGILLGEKREEMTRVVVRALLAEDKGVRSCAAGLGWSVVGRLWSGRRGEGGEEWEVEVTSALVEALRNEGESVEVVHRLAATIGLLLFQSPHYEELQALVEVLGLAEVLREKEELVKGKQEVVEVLREVGVLCL